MKDADLNAALAALQAMPERTRAAFVLHCFEGWPYTRIAEHLGIRPRVVERHMRRAVASLHDTLDEAEA